MGNKFELPYSTGTIKIARLARNELVIQYLKAIVSHMSSTLESFVCNSTFFVTGTNKRAKIEIWLTSIIEGKEDIPCTILFVKISMIDPPPKIAESLMDLYV